MTIESKSAAVQLELQRRATIAAYATQRFAENAAPITAAQAVDIDAALTALQTSLLAAGFGTAPLPATQAVVSNGVALPVAATGTGTTVTCTVAGGVITAVTLS